MSASILSRMIRSKRSFGGSLLTGAIVGSLELLLTSSIDLSFHGILPKTDFSSAKAPGVGMDKLSRVVRSLKSFVRSSYESFTGSMVLSEGLRYFRIVLSFNLSSVNCICCSSWTPFTTLEVQHGWLVL